MTTDPLDFKMSKAKTTLLFDHPFFASLALNMKWVRDDTLNPATMATDGETIYWHGEFVAKHTQDVLRAVVCHEVLHCVFQHMMRRGSRDPYNWNVATDVVINDLIKREKIGTLPEGCIDMPQLAQAGNYMAEQVYNLLPPPPPQGQQGQPGIQGTPLDALKDAKGTAAEQSEKANQMKVRVAQAAQAAKMCGKMSSGLERIVTEVLQPKVDWKDVLRRFVSVRAKTETSYARPKRRFLGEDLYLPSKSGETLGELYLAVDCSGSIGARELAEFTTEIKAIHEDLRPSRIHVVYFDSEISHYEQYEQEDTLNIKPHGGGGTAFSPIFAYADKHGIEPCACVVLTDLYCGDFGGAPSYPVLWVTNGATEAPWGEIVKLKVA